MEAFFQKNVSKAGWMKTLFLLVGALTVFTMGNIAMEQIFPKRNKLITGGVTAAAGVFGVAYGKHDLVVGGSSGLFLHGFRDLVSGLTETNDNGNSIIDPSTTVGEYMVIGAGLNGLNGSNLGNVFTNKEIGLLGTHHNMGDVNKFPVTYEAPGIETLEADPIDIANTSSLEGAGFTAVEIL